MKSQESIENYLENILMLSKHDTPVRSVDLARVMDFSKPSISRAVHKMEDMGFLNIGENGHLTLTKEGYERAVAIYERHLFLTQYFMALGIDEATAANDACRMEHGLSAETFARMKMHISHCAHGCTSEPALKVFDFGNVDLKAIEKEISLASQPED